MTEPERRACVAGLITTAEPAASAASVEPAGIATGKFHGGVTTVRFGWDERGAVDRFQVLGALGVVVREVDRLADLGVGLVDGLAGLGGHDLDELGAAGFQDVACAVQDGGALGGRSGRPRSSPASTAAAMMRLQFRRGR